MTDVSIDREACMFQGLCADAAPTVFAFDDESGPAVLLPQPLAGDADAARLAARMCPARAIAVTEPVRGR